MARVMEINVPRLHASPAHWLGDMIDQDERALAAGDMIDQDERALAARIACPLARRYD